jgi:CheY-like chemotaxis protein
MQVLAERVGFRLVLSAGRAEAVPDPICFFLIDYRVVDDDKRQLLMRLRSSPAPDLRFAPVIVVVGSCPAEEVMRYVRLGFDDVIALPASAATLASRLETQLSSEHTYYETATYFGPDRRRAPREETPNGNRPAGRVIEHHFIRDPLSGIRLVRPPAAPFRAIPGLTETMHHLAHN